MKCDVSFWVILFLAAWKAVELIGWAFYTAFSYYR